MRDYYIVDAHIHCFRSPEAARAALGWTPMGTDFYGAPEQALADMKGKGIARAVMVNTIPIGFMKIARLRQVPPEQRNSQLENEIREAMRARLERLNSWTCEMAQRYPDLLGCITLDPMFGPDFLREEVRKRAGEGARGIKLHPVIGHYFPDEPRMWPAYEEAEKQGLFIISHCGPEPHLHEAGAPPSMYSTWPRQFELVCQKFPQLTLIIAHLGVSPQNKDWELFYEPFYEEAITLARKKYPNCYWDTSACTPKANLGYGFTREKMVKLIQEIGADHVLFGSDWPAVDSGVVIQELLELGLTEEENRLILGENARRLFKL